MMLKHHRAQHCVLPEDHPSTAAYVRGVRANVKTCIDSVLGI
jgi:hypothetical protein